MIPEFLLVQALQPNTPVALPEWVLWIIGALSSVGVFAWLWNVLKAYIALKLKEQAKTFEEKISADRETRQAQIRSEDALNTQNSALLELIRGQSQQNARLNDILDAQSAQNAALHAQAARERAGVLEQITGRLTFIQSEQAAHREASAGSFADVKREITELKAAVNKLQTTVDELPDDERMSSILADGMRVVLEAVKALNVVIEAKPEPITPPPAAAEPVQAPLS